MSRRKLSRNSHRHDGLRHSGIGLDRRHDKLKEVSGQDDDGNAYVYFEPRVESKFERAARLGRIGLRHA